MSSKSTHLELIQNIVNRMATNSFLLKGWSVTLVAALFALASKEADISYVLIAAVPVVMFWLLDGFFLCRERGFRDLYDEMRSRKEEDIDFSMDISHLCVGKNTWVKSSFSSTLLIFYVPLLIVMAIVTKLII